MPEGRARSPSELVRLNVSLQGRILGRDRLEPAVGPGSEELPRVYLFRTSEGELLFCHASLERATVEGLRSRGASALWDQPDLARAALDADRGLRRPWLGAGPGFEGLWFDHDPRAVEREGAVERNGGFDAMVEGVVASRAFSSRENRWAAELAVRTEPAFRRKGFARRVSSAWAHAILSSGRVPFYSYIRGNEESGRLAASLHVREYATSLAIY